MRGVLTNLRLRWRAMWKRRQLESDLEDELGFHLAMREQKNRQAGVAQSARRSFGNPALVKEDLRDQWTFRAIETFWKDLRYAARSESRTNDCTCFSKAVTCLFWRSFGLKDCRRSTGKWLEMVLVASTRSCQLNDETASWDPGPVGAPPPPGTRCRR